MVKHKMTERQKHFADNYLELGNVAQSALKAGYSEAFAVIGDDERMEKLSTNPAGIDTLFTFAWQQLSAASEIPKSVLTGQESGTLTGAQYDIVNYYDGIKAQQEQLLRPQIEYIVKLLMHARNIAGGSEDPDSMDWHIEKTPFEIINSTRGHY